MLTEELSYCLTYKSRQHFFFQIHFLKSYFYFKNLSLISNGNTIVVHFFKIDYKRSFTGLPTCNLGSSFRLHTTEF